jgi:hypothetical protein
MTTLNRFRIVKLPDELQKESGLPKLICADPNGLPFWEGSAFYTWITDNACEPATARNYLNAILPFLTFLWNGPPPLQFTAPVEQIRNRVRDYLKERLGCAVRPHRNGNYLVKRSKAIAVTSAGLFLTALRRFYYCARLMGWYTDADPFEWFTPLDVPGHELKLQMPPRSGLTLPDDKRGRRPGTYFCVVSEDWQPRIIDDPRLRQQLIPAFTRTRDRVIARILFDSGARISEVLRLTIGDWRKLGQRERALAINKGSRGERVKEIWWSADTAQALRDYINHERRLCEPQGRELHDLPDLTPVFLTDDGRPYSYAALYANWQKACEKAQLKVTPHQVRHWYVTMALHVIESQADEAKRNAYRQSLIAYMGWQNPATIHAYDHHIRQLDFATIHAALARLGETQDLNAVEASPHDISCSVSMNTISEELEDWLSQNFGWKE